MRAIDNEHGFTALMTRYGYVWKKIVDVTRVTSTEIRSDLGIEMKQLKDKIGN